MSFIKNNIVVAISNIGIKLHSFILMGLLINFISLDAYSDYIIVFSFVSFLTGISSVGVGFFYKRYFPSAESARRKQELFYPQFLFNLLFSIGIILFLFLSKKSVINNLFDNKIGINYYLILVYFFSYVIYSQTTDYFRYSNKMSIYSSVTLLTPYIWLLWVLLLKRFFPQIVTLDVVVGSIIVVLNSINIILLFYISRSIGFSMRSFTEYNLLKDIRIGLPLVLVILANWAITASDRFFILQYLDKAKVGFYSAAYSIGTLINFLPLVLGVIMPPMLSIMVDKNNSEQANKYVNYSVIGFIGIAIPFCAGAFFTGENILALISKNSICLESKFVITLIGLGALLNGLVVILSTVLFVHHRTKNILYATILGMFGSVILNLIFLPIFHSIIVCSIANFFSNLLTLIFISYGLRKGSDVKIDNIAIFKISFSTIMMIMSLIMVALYFNNKTTTDIIQLFSKILVGGIAYGLSMALLFPKYRIVLVKMGVDMVKFKF